jgi:hypothetical protein
LNAFDLKFLEFGRTTGSMFHPTVMSDLMDAIKALGIISQISAIAPGAARIASRAVCRGLEDIAMGECSVLPPQVAQELILAHLHSLPGLVESSYGGYFLWLKVEYKTCKQCTIWDPLARYYMRKYCCVTTNCKTGKIKKQQKWHPCEAESTSNNPEGRVITNRGDEILSITFSEALRNCIMKACHDPTRSRPKGHY